MDKREGGVYICNAPPYTSVTPPVYICNALLYWIPCIGFPIWIKIPVFAYARKMSGENSPERPCPTRTLPHSCQSWLSDSSGVILVAKALRLVSQQVVRCLRKPSDTVGEPTSTFQDRFFSRKLLQLFCLQRRHV